MKKIYIIGEVRGSYRTQNLIKVLLDRNFRVFYNSFTFNILIDAKNIFQKVLRKILRLLEKIFLLPFKVYMIGLSDVVILSAMNNEKQFEFNVAHLLRKKIITDYYISFYDTAVLDRKTIMIDSAKATKLKNNDTNIIKNASMVFFLNRTEAKRYLELANVNASQVEIEIVPLCIEEKLPVKLPYFNGYKDYLSICWWGTYIPLHGLEKIIESGKILKENKVKFKMYLFGDSEEKATHYKNLINKLELSEDILIINDYTFKNGKLGKFLVENCDLVLGNFGDSDKAKTVLVNKLLDGVAMKAPVLTGESIAPKEFFNGQNDIWYSLNTPERIAKAILEISNSSKQEINNRINNAYEVYENNFSERAFTEKILNAIEKV